MTKAVEWKLPGKHPFKMGKSLKFKLDNQRKRFLTEAEIEALVRECPRHLKPIVQTAMLTGMRKEEVLGLRWNQIRDGSRDGFIYLEGAMTKSGTSRQIPINEGLAEIFREVRRVDGLKLEYVFCDAQGRRFKYVKRSLAGACRRAGIVYGRENGLTFHDLRHTFASHLVMNGVGLKAVQELLGHTDLKMTMRYAHLSHDHLRDAVAVLNNLPSVNKSIKKSPESPKEGITASL